MKHSDFFAFHTKNPFNLLGAGLSIYLTLYHPQLLQLVEK